MDDPVPEDLHVGGGFADYCLPLRGRGRPNSQQHGGISVFIVPSRHARLTIQPMYGPNSHDSNTVFYDDVKLPADAIVGGSTKAGRS